jgi:hypothetical protein
VIPRDLAAWAVLIASAAGVAYLQPRLAHTVHAVKARDDVYVLPPPADLHASLLGWDAAAVDLLWAKLLVEYGLHWSEHREFRDVPSYVDAILEIEPTYGPVYRYVDTMLAYRPLQGTEADVRAARAYLERGTRERPLDARLWMECGQFVAFIGPSFLHADADREAWREDGARFIERAVELGADADVAIAAASILTRAGATAEAVRYLERAYAFTEHPSMTEVHEAIGKRLAAMEDSTMRDRADEIARTIDARWASELPFLTRSAYLLLGPAVDTARCAGLAAIDDERCRRDWLIAESPGSSEGSP